MQQLRRKEIEELSSLSISSFDTMQLDYYPNTVDKALGESVRSYMARVLADLRDYAADFSCHPRKPAAGGQCRAGQDSCRPCHCR